jgi:DTW domain-containing protein YfiP
VPPARRLRRAPAPDRLATIEAIARALDLLEGGTAGAELDALFAEHVARCLPG